MLVWAKWPFFPLNCVWTTSDTTTTFQPLIRKYTLKILVRINIGGGGGWSVIRGESQGQRKSYICFLVSFSDFRREVNENCALRLITKRAVAISYDVSGQPIDKDGQESKLFTFKMRPIGWPETSVRNHHYSLRNILLVKMVTNPNSWSLKVGPTGCPETW
jgi:hypothetical protein